MNISRNRLYLLLAAACTAGYSWLFINYRFGISNPELNCCLIKQVTTIPCPSCGATRSVAALLNGHILEAAFWNPIGIVLFAVMLVLPLWLGYDVVFKKSTLHRFYLKAEIILRKKWIAIPAIALVLANWMWNIHKGL